MQLCNYALNEDLKMLNAKIISVAAQKGGVAKTTTAVNLASCIAMRAAPVLLIDIDPQNSSTDWVCLMEEKGQRLFDYIKAEPQNLEAYLSQSRTKYKYIIIDCAPRLEKVINKVIHCSDLILCPVAVGALEEWAFDDFTVGVKDHQESFDGKPAFRVFLSKVDNRWKRLTRQTEATLKDEGYIQFQTIHSREAVCHAVGLAKITIHMDDSEATREIETLTTQVLEVVDNET